MKVQSLNDFKKTGTVKEIARNRDYGYTMTIISRCKHVLNMKYIGKSDEDDSEIYEGGEYSLCVCLYNDALFGEQSAVWLRSIDKKSLNDAIDKLKLVYTPTTPLLSVILDDYWFDIQITLVRISKIPVKCSDILVNNREKIINGIPKKQAIISCQKELIDAGF